MLLGSAGAVDPEPCTPTSTEIISNFSFDDPSNWTFVDIGNGQTGNISGGGLNYPDGGFISDYWLQLVDIDSTKEYILTVQKTYLEGGDPQPTITIAYQTIDGKTANTNLTGTNGVLSGPIHPADWVVGANGLFTGAGLDGTVHGVLIVIDSGGSYSGGVIDFLSLTLEECI